MSDLDDAAPASVAEPELDPSGRPMRNITIRSLSVPDADNGPGNDRTAVEQAVAPAVAPPADTAASPEAVVSGPASSDENATSGADAPSSKNQPFDPAGKIRVIPVDHDPFNGGYEPRFFPVGHEPFAPTSRDEMGSESFGSGASSRLTIPTSRGQVADNPEWFWPEVARRTAADPYADPFNAPTAGAASAPDAWHTMGVVQPALLEQASESLASFLGGGYRDDPIYRMVKEGRWNDLGNYLGKLHEQGVAELGGAIEAAIRQATAAPYDADFAKSETDPAALERAARKSFDIASTVATPSVGRAAAMGGVGELGTFGGRIGARNIPAAKSALKQAEEMEAAGYDRNEIWRQTGWGRGKEGLWEFEIPDQDLRPKYYDPAVHADREGFKLSDLIDHPELEKAYGDYFDKKLRIIFDPRSKVPAYSRDLFGAYDLIVLKPRGSGYAPGEIVLNRYQTEALLHELNHVVSSIEGRSRGGQLSGKVIEYVAVQLAMMGQPLHEIERIILRYYKSLADEVRSRTVAGRYGLGKEELRETPPWETSMNDGFSEESQIVPAPLSRARTENRRNLIDAKNIIERMRAYGLLGDVQQ